GRLKSVFEIAVSLLDARDARVTALENVLQLAFVHVGTVGKRAHLVEVLARGGELDLRKEPIYLEPRTHLDVPAGRTAAVVAHAVDEELPGRFCGHLLRLPADRRRDLIVV